MVSYQTLTAIAFEVVKAKGAEFDGQTPKNAQAVVSAVAKEWNENTEEYRQMTEAQAERAMNELLVVN